MLYLELIILYNDIAIRFHYYNILLIVSIIKCIRKEAVFNEVYIIIFITRLLLMNCDSQKFWFFLKTNFIQNVCLFPKSYLNIWVLSTSSITEKRKTNLLTFWPRTVLVIKLNLTLEKAAFSEKVLLSFPCLQNHCRIMLYSLSAQWTNDAFEEVSWLSGFFFSLLILWFLLLLFLVLS